jgi:hypothetical protein
MFLGKAGFPLRSAAGMTIQDIVSVFKLFMSPFPIAPDE